MGADDPAPTGGLWSYDGGWTSGGTSPASPDASDDAGRPAGPTRRERPVGDSNGSSGSSRTGSSGDRDRSRFGDGGSSGFVASRSGGPGGDRRQSGTPADRSGGKRREQGTGERPRHPEDASGNPESVARAICLRLLTVQPRTRAELAAALTKRGVPDDAAETVLSRFTEVGLIDDRAFAATWVDSRHSGRGLARRALAAELRKRGIDGDVVGEAVAVVDAEAEDRAARQLVARRLTATRRLDQPTRVRRLAGMLARKGYPPGVAMRAVRDALAAEGDDPGELDGLDDTTPEDP